jgi:RNA polymerase sigma factor (sigma-70 family)
VGLLGIASWRVYLSRMVLEDLIKTYIPALRRLAVSYTQNRHESEDLFQEIAVVLWKALPKFRGDCSERTFVYRVAHNTAIRFVTSQQRRSGREHAVFENEVEPASPDNPELDAIRNQQWNALWSAVRELPVIDRQVVLLRLEGLSMAEIAEVTGSTEGAVTMRFSRVRRQLGERLTGARKVEQ